MVNLFEVIDEAVGITESVVTAVTDLSQRNNPHLPLNSNFPPVVFLVPIDIPPLTDDCCADPVFLAVVITADRSATWSGGFIEVSYDGGLTFVKRAEYIDESATGFVVPGSTGDQTLGNPLPDRWDVFSQVTVEMKSGYTLESKTRAEVLDGANVMLINGEIRAFSTAVEIDPEFTDPPFGQGRTYVLTDWIRGMRGTPIDVLDGVREIGSDRTGLYLVVDLNEPIAAVMMPVGDDDLDLEYRARDRNDTEGIEGVAVTLTGANLKPRPVIFVVVTKQTNSDWVIAWTGVSRSPCTQILSARGAADDDPETYSVRILDGVGGSIVRTISATSQTATYTSAQQVTDFGSNQTTIFVSVIRTADWVNSDAVEA